MVIENIMYFVLGLLMAGLLALLIVPAVWQRAVRLTKKRIEAATPMTMAEFRADKDQLRAEFALSTRRLEMNVEALRRRLAEQLRDINRKKNELGGIKGERDQHLQIVRELEEREAELRRRVLELEKEGADVAQKLRMRDREYAEKVSQLEAARETLRGNAPRPFALDGKPLSGDYNADIDEVLGALEVERKRAEFLETQNRGLIEQLESSNRSTEAAATEAAELRARVARKDDSASAAAGELIAAEARIADAESRVTAILAETAKTVDASEQRHDILLAERLGIEEEMERLRGKVADVETTVMRDWDTDRIEQSHLRERLNDIASDVGRLVYALEGNGMRDGDESLFEKVQKFAGEDMAAPEPVRPMGPGRPTPDLPSVADRLKALRELQDGN
jgi:DNA repair exonuclease SbcCD ATPase subunit